MTHTLRAVFAHDDSERFHHLSVVLVCTCGWESKETNPGTLAARQWNDHLDLMRRHGKLTGEPKVYW